MPRNPDALPTLPEDYVIISMAAAGYKHLTNSGYEDIRIDSIEKVRVFPDGYDYVACLTIARKVYKTVRLANGALDASDEKVIAKTQYGMMFRLYPDQGWVAPLFRHRDGEMGSRKVNEICPEKTN